jgi:uncharacterized protein YjbI with pentapeptide repeats
VIAPRRYRLAGAGAAVAASALFSLVSAPALRAGSHLARARATIPASLIIRRLASGEAVNLSSVVIRGTLRLPSGLDAALNLRDVTVDGGLVFPPDVHAPVALHAVTVRGAVAGISTTFEKLADLQGSIVMAGADFSGASFDGPAIFTGLRTCPPASKPPCKTTPPVSFRFASFHSIALFAGVVLTGTADFTGAQFDEVSRFRQGDFKRQTTFNSAWFGDIADFGATTFENRGLFSAVEFRSVADFTGSEFYGAASFRGTRFSTLADFTGASFGVLRPRLASFSAARFDGGANFLGTEFNGVAGFETTHSSGDLVFDGASLENGAVFVASRLLGNTSFNNVQLRGPLNFDEASLAQLDLDGLALINNSARVTLPTSPTSPLQPGFGGHMGQLRFDPGDVRGIAVSDRGRESALALMQTAALAGGDGKAASAAQYDRWTLMRHHREFFLRIGDWLFLWGVGGYLVRPWHQVITVGALLLLATLIRIYWPANRPRWRKRTFRRNRRRFWNAIRRPESWRWLLHSRTAPKRAPATTAPAALKSLAAAAAAAAAADSGRAAHAAKRQRRRYEIARIRVRLTTRFWPCFRPSVGALWRLQIQGGGFTATVEALVYKAVIAVFFLSLANVWPTGHDLLKGVLPF